MSNDEGKTFDQILAETRAQMMTEQQSAEEKAREEREEHLRRAAAVNYDALQSRFIGADINTQQGADAALAAINTATAVLMGEQPSSVPTLVATSNAPFDWDSLNEDQKKAMQLIAENKGRFFVKPSGALRDRQGHQLDQEHREARESASASRSTATPATGASDNSGAPAPEPTPAPAPTPAVVPAKKAVPKKTTTAPVTDTPAQPSGNRADDIVGGPKKQPVVDRLKDAFRHLD